MPTLQLAHDRRLAWGEGRTLVMGIVNTTPDSFSDGGLHADIESAVDHALTLASEGADIVDIGGESSRPGAQDVPLEEEMRRVLPVVERLAAERPDILLSVDTVKPLLARRAIEAGAHLINDISGGAADPAMATAVVETGAAYCLMHMQGAPRTMQKDPQYDNVVEEVGLFFRERLEAMVQAGLPHSDDAPFGGRVMLDPGIGFGKRLEHNLELIGASKRYEDELGCPVLIGASRKSMLGQLTGIADPARRDRPTIAVHIAAVARGAAMLRVHDVAAAVESLRVADPILRAHESN